MEYIVDYPHLCDSCQTLIAQLAQHLIPEFEDTYASDPEGPCMFAYDKGLFCGDHECVDGEDQDEYTGFTAIYVDPHSWEFFYPFPIWEGKDEDYRDALRNLRDSNVIGFRRNDSSFRYADANSPWYGEKITVLCDIVPGRSYFYDMPEIEKMYPV